MIKLIEGNKKYLKGYKEAYLLMKEKVEKGIVKNKDSGFKNPDKIDIIQAMKDAKTKDKLKPGYVISYNYWIVEDDKFIGRIDIRTELTPALLQRGGHIGYTINPKYWKMGYGTEALRLALIKCKEMGLNRVLITCDEDNIGSQKIIEKNGGILENKTKITSEKYGVTFFSRRYWINL